MNVFIHQSTEHQVYKLIFERNSGLSHRAMIYLFIKLIIFLQCTRYYRHKVDGHRHPTMEHLTLSQEIEFALLEERTNFEYTKHLQIVNNFYEKRKNWYTSNVGTFIFKDPTKEYFKSFAKSQAKTFVIFIYNQWSILYTGADLENGTLGTILNGCSVKNCIFTRDKRVIHSADAILVNMYKGQYPTFPKKNHHQKWILFNMESPKNTFGGYQFSHTLGLRNFSDVFNWIMNYRSDSDVPVPYGRVEPLQIPTIVDFSNPEKALSLLVPSWSLKQYKYLVVTLVSNCIFKDRIRFMRDLIKYIDLDAYGRCGVDKNLRKSCVGNITEACPVLDHYIFYLALENSGCRQYLTEKIFYNAYAKGAIPIIWGPPIEDCKKLLPPNSFLHVNDYESYEQLAGHLKRIIQVKEELLSYHKWRKHFRVVNEHGFFGTQPMQFCRLCEALNYNDRTTKTYSYDELRLYFDRNITCYDRDDKVKPTFITNRKPTRIHSSQYKYEPL